MVVKEKASFSVKKTKLFLEEEGYGIFCQAILRLNNKGIV
jgi:hypothetical protein